MLITLSIWKLYLCEPKKDKFVFECKLAKLWQRQIWFCILAHTVLVLYTMHYNEWCECFGKSVVDVRYCTFNMCVKHLSDCWKLDCFEHCLGSYSLCSHNLSSLARFEHVTCEHVTAGQFVHWWKFSVLNTTAMQISYHVFYLCTNLYT